MAEQVSFIFQPMGGLHQYVVAKRACALGIATNQRHPLCQDVPTNVPTIKALGFAAFEAAPSWNGMLAPAGVIRNSMESDYLKKRAERWRRVIRNAGIKPE